MDRQDFVYLFQSFANRHGYGVPIPEEVVERAISLAESGEREVRRYSFGMPKLEDVYEIAFELLPRN